MKYLMPDGTARDPRRLFTETGSTAGTPDAPCAADGTANVVATVWPDCEALLLIAQVGVDGFAHVAVGGVTFDGDHMEIPENPYATVVRADGQLVLTVADRRIGQCAVPNRQWQDAPTCLVGIMRIQPPLPATASVVADRFLTELDAGEACISLVEIHDVEWTARDQKRIDGRR